MPKKVPPPLPLTYEAIKYVVWAEKICNINMPHTQVVIVVDVESRELYSNIYPQMFLVNQLLFLNPFQRRTRSSKKMYWILVIHLHSKKISHSGSPRRIDALTVPLTPIWSWCGLNYSCNIEEVISGSPLRLTPWTYIFILSASLLKLEEMCRLSSPQR